MSKKKPKKNTQKRPLKSAPKADFRLPKLLQLFDSLSPEHRVLPNPAEMRAMDSAAIEAGISSLELMERAGEATVNQVISMAGGRGRRCLVTIVCGPGNNGGDGLVAARLLPQRKFEVRVILCQASRYSGEYLHQLSLLRRARLSISVLKGADHNFPDDTLAKLFSTISEQKLEETLNDSQVVVDAILGTGQHSDPTGSLALAINCINSAKRSNPELHVLSVDLPSGVDANEGKAFSPAIFADSTLAIEFLKRGLLQFPAHQHCGQLSVAPIGISSVAAQRGLLPRTYVLGPWPHDYTTPNCGLSGLGLAPRPAHAHKGNFLKVLVAGGTPAMPGAVVLTGYAALRAGAPLVTVCFAQGSPAVFAPPELIRLPFTGPPGPLWLAALMEFLNSGPCVLALGPGLGLSGDAILLVDELLTLVEKKGIPLVLDADGLNCLAALMKKGKSWRLPSAVLTPHPGEMSRLLGCGSAQVQAARHQCVSALARRLSATVVLKGAATVIASGAVPGSTPLSSTSAEQELPIAVNVCGTPWLATGGSGDVLTGIIAALIAQGKEPHAAAKAGVFTHAMCSEALRARLGDAPIIATDLISEIPAVISKLSHPHENQAC